MRTSTRRFKKLLIANRGEIAVRIARTCRNLGIRTVGVFSEQDRRSLHLDFCDEVISLGEGALSETYLNIPKIVEAIGRSRVDAVHPGYGFLSERAAFARAVTGAGAVFVGPSPESIEAMGDKIEAKRRMAAMGVPLLPGTEGGVKDFSEAKKAAAKIGYPVLLKAAAGGGGKGMRIVRGGKNSEKELAAALESASREAKNYFGDGTVYIEKFLENPHHVEVQVLGDGHGGGGHVFDRECSIQRRHQKLVEESPAPLLMKHPKAKERILEVAAQVVERMKYANAGTLEFLADDDGGFYFLEMNTRLQVEHPVTEWVTGLDLVERQLRVAEGERLKSGELTGGKKAEQRGHSIEVRVYAETPFEYLPCGGTVKALRLPCGPFVRVDSAIYPGYEVLTDYDPTLMKLSVWGADRAGAVARLRSAIGELRILGVGSNQGFFFALTREKYFIDGNYATPYIDRRMNDLKAIHGAEMARLLPRLAQAAVEAARTRPAGTLVQAGEKAREARSAWESAARKAAIRGET